MANLLPPFIARQYRQGCFGGEFEAVALFVDISGFTKMTEALMQHGIEGAEILAGTLRAVFDPMIDTVYACGGIITGFAGDAFTAVFPVADTGAEAYRRAVAAAWAMHGQFLQTPTQSTRFGVFGFAIKLGVADGLVEWGIIRSPEPPYQQVYYFKGSAIANCVAAEHLARTGDVILSRAVYQQLEEEIRVDVWREGHVLLTDVVATAPVPKAKTFEPIEPVDLTAFFPPEVIDLGFSGEFRQVVTVFVNIREAVIPHIRPLMNQVLSLVQKYRGCLTRLEFGDKGCMLLIFWGAPLRFENDAERALNFLLDAREYFSENASLAKGELAAGEMFRAGVTSMLMYAGYAGGMRQGEFTCYGRGINMAARIVMNAGWGEIRLGREIYKLIEVKFDAELKEKQSFKGFAKPLPVYTLRGRKSYGFRLMFEGPLMDRTAELEQLQRFIEPVLAPPGTGAHFAGILYIHGDMGLGKSRLIFDFRTGFLRQHLVWWLFCPCDEILKQPFNPFKHALIRYFKLTEARSQSEKQLCFKTGFDALLQTIEDARFLAETKSELLADFGRGEVFLAAFLDVEAPGRYLQQMEAKLRYENMLTAVKIFIKVLCLTRPVIISLDDAQWLDADSRQLLRHLAVNMDSYPLAIISASRYLDDGRSVHIDFDPAIPEQTLALRPLTPDGIGRIAGQIFQTAGMTGAALNPDFIKFLSEKSQGNPFYVTQFCLFLLENHPQILADAQLLSQNLNDLQIPQDVNAVITARLDRLKNLHREMIKVAAVLGVEFETIFLLLTLRQVDSQFPVNSFYSNLEVLELENIWRASSHARCIFQHSAVRETAYDMQLRARLRQTHICAAEAIESLNWGDPRYYPEIAYHYEQAEHIEKAVEYLQKAGDDAVAHYHNHQALNYFSRLQNLIRTDPNRAALYLHVQHRIARLLKLTGQWAEAEAAFYQALELAQKQAEPKITVRILRRLSNLLLLRGQDEAAQQCLDEALTLSESSGDMTGMAIAYGMLGKIYLRSGHNQQALLCFEKDLQFSLEGQEILVIPHAYGNLGDVYWQQGNFERAYEFYLLQLQIFEDFDEPGGKANADLGLGNACWRLGNYDRALQHYRTALEIWQRLGDQHRIAMVLEKIGTVYSEQGDLEAAMDYFKKRLKTAQDLGDRDGVAVTSRLIGAAYRKMENYAQAMHWLEKARTLNEKIDNKGEVKVVLFNIGCAFQALGEYWRAEDYLQQCLAINRELGDKNGEAISLGHLAWIYYDMQDYDQASQYYEAAIDLARQIGIKFWLAAFLLGKTNFLIKHGFIEAAKVTHTEGTQLAREVKAQVLIESSEILQAQIEAKSGAADAAVTRLTALLALTTDPVQKARVHYEIFRLTETWPDAVAYREHGLTALQMYTDLFARTQNATYGRRAETLIKSIEAPDTKSRQTRSTN